MKLAQEGMRAVGAAAHLELRLSQCLSPAFAREKPSIEAHHKILGGIISNFPKTRHLGLRASQDERSPQPVDTLARLHVPNACLARREHHEPCAGKIKR